MYEAFLKRWEDRVASLEEYNLQTRKQHRIISVKTLDFRRTYHEFKTFLEASLSGRVLYLRFDELPMTVPDVAIIDMAGCVMSDDILFTVEELLIFQGYSRL